MPRFTTLRLKRFIGFSSLFLISFLGYSQQDSLALVALYDSTNGDGWNNNTNWKTGPIPTWFGVTYGGGRVTKLELPSNNLTGGSLPPSIGDLTMATTIDLNNNNLIDQIPVEIGNAIALDTLNLSNSGVNGVLPSEIGNLVNLTYLDLSLNNLTDSLPNEITNLSVLINLQLQGNQIDWLPDLSIMSSLSTLDISSNNLEFDDILPLVGIPSITYSPQGQIGTQLDTAVVIGDTFTVQRLSPGAGNIYQWQKDDVDMPGETSEILQILNFSSGDSAKYNLIVTNGTAPALALSSRNINVMVEDTTYFKAVQVSAFIGQSANLAVGWGDVNNDGFDDLIPTGSTGLYLNNGNGTFSVGIGDLVTNGGGFGPTSGDIDNDGDIDVFVANASNPRLHINDGSGNMSLSGGGDLSTLTGDFQDYVWGDYDNDGFIDLFITAGSNVGSEVNYLMRNNGDGTFSTISTGAIATDLEGSVSASWSDYDNDGDIDLYVLNASGVTPNSLYQNNGDGSFTKVVSSELINDTFGSFSSSWGDYNNDGFMDVFVTNSFNDPVLFENNGAGDFIRVAGVITLGDPFGSTWGDIDNDGLLDLLVSSFSNTNHLYLNNGDGTFTEAIGGSFLSSGALPPMAFTDYNNDGRLDFVNRKGDWVLYENTQEGNNYLQVKLDGTISNRSGIGAKVRVKADIGGQPTWQLREISAGTGLFSQNSLTAHFGMGDATIADSVIVEWPSGVFQEMTNVGINQLLNIIEPDFVNTSDSLALVAIYDSLGGGSWNDTTNWKIGPVNTWVGVVVSGDRVVRLDLAGQNLNGQMPPAIGDLTALEVLNVDNNFSLSGPIPAEISNAVALDSLILSNARFNDTIPIEIGNLPNLVYLDLNNNSIAAVPPEITNLSILDYLDLGNNQLQDLPDLTAFSGLSFLGLAGNNLTFEDLDVNSAIPGISYSPQDPIGVDSLAALAIGESGTLITQLQNYNGNNSYQWYKDATPIPGETGPTLTAPSWSVTDEGVYYLEATNPAVPGLTLSSGNFTIFTKEQSQFTWINDPLFIEEGLASAASYGAIVSDYDNDGYDDLFTMNLDGIPSYLYRNLGDGTFERTTSAIPSGADNGAYSSAWGDYNNDGFLDLFVSDFQFNNSISDGVASIYRNNGDGTFTSISLDESIFGSAWGDVNNDGLLDAAANVNGDSLFIFMNVGTDTLVKQTAVADLSLTNGTVVPFLVDLSGDGYVDLYITGTPNHLYFNDGAGNFIEQPTNALITTTLDGPWGASFEDLDNDGDIDAFIRSYLPNADSYIFTNDGSGNFTGATCFEVFGESCNRGRGSAIADINNDGYVDIIFNEGSGTDTLEVYFNNANVGYTQLTNQNFLGTIFARGIPIFDYNNDGALDIYSSSSFLNRANMLYENNGNGNNWLKVKLEGTISNRSAVGAQVSVYTGGLRNTRNVITNSGLHSGASNYLHFGMGGNVQADSIVVKWPSGLINRLNNVTANQLVYILEELKDPVLASDSSALVALYNATNGDSWAINSNWLQQGQFVQDWHGVTVENNRVTRIELYANNLFGSIPPEIGDLDSLRYLNLGDEVFGGNNMSGSIPDEIGNLSNLEFLALAGNQLAGPIPEAIGNLSQLKKIDFAFNQLEDPIPDTLSTLSNLRYLGIAFNSFTDIPLSIYTLPALDTLLTSGNQLAGPIPPEIGSMSTLKFLNIGGNLYEGQLPPEFGNLTQLQGIRIWDMPGITGNIPPEWAGMTAIGEFSLTNLSLSGTIPDFVGDFGNAFTINLWGNQFSGAVPTTFSNLSADVSLFGNALTSVPTLSNLFSLDVRKNRLLFEDLVPNDSISIPDIAEQNERYLLDVSGSITAGGTVTLTVINSTLGDNEFQWVKDGELLSGENAPALILTSLDGSHIGVYTCLIQRPGGNGSYSGIPSESVSIDINETSRRYATAVDSVTSEAKIVDYQAIEILGLPNRGFDDNDDPNDGQLVTLDAQERGWAPAADDTAPFIEVSFENPTPINSIWLFGSAGVWVDALNPTTSEFERIVNFVPGGNNGKETEVNFPTTSYGVSQLRIYTSTATGNTGLGPFSSVDAVAIGDNGLEISTPYNLFLSQKITETIFNIGWSHYNNDDSTSFSVERSTDGTNFTEVALIDDGFSRLSDRSVPIADTIYYRVRAIRGAIESEYSEVLLIENCPSGLSGFPVGSWTGIAEEVTPIFSVSGFSDNVQITDNGNGTYTIADFMANYLADGFGFTGPNIGTLSEGCNGLDFQGELVAGCGNNSVFSNFVEFYPASDSLIIEFTWDCGGDIRLTFTKNASEPAQDPPFNLSVSTVNSNAVQLMWQDNTSEDLWIIERSENDNLNYVIIDGVSPNPQSETGGAEYETYLDNSVFPGTTYFYRIVAQSGGLDSAPSEEVSIDVINPLFNMLTIGPIVNDQPSNSYAGSWGDYDGDGDPDLYVSNWHSGLDPAIATMENYLYENDGGVFNRASLSNEITDSEFISRGTYWGDFDNDGNLDVFINGEGSSNFINDAKSYLFFGNGAGGFDTKLEFRPQTFNSTPADINNDGLLDLFITDIDIILENRGDRNFVPIRDGSSIINGDFFSSSWTNLTPDFNNDGLPDLVSSGNPFIEIYENKGDFLYEKIYEANDNIISARGATFGDFDHNGYLDIVIADRAQSKLFLFDDTGISQILDDGDFLGEDITGQRGLTVIDYDNDGNEDLLWVINSGQPVLFSGNGDGTFIRVSEFEQIFANTTIFSSVSTADFDQDGFVDVFISSTDDSRSNSLYANNGSSLNNYLRVDLEGTESNRLGIGSHIRIKHGGQWYMKQVTGVNGLWSSNEITTHFGVGSATTIDSVEVRWTSGNVNQFADIDVNQTISFVEDVTPPVVSVDVLGTSISSPEITGTIDDLNATLELTINGSTYIVSTFNAGDSTWSLPAGTITPDLTDGVYDVQAVATDANGNVGVDDLEGELTITQSLRALVASKRTSSSFQANWSEALDVEEYLLDVSLDADFSTFLTGFEDFSTTERKAVITGLDFSTTYYYRVRFVNTASETSDYSNDTTAVTRIKPETVSDFNALEAIYNATNGENWTDDGGWTTEPRLQNWDFITLEDQRVAEIIIPGNNLTGTFPLTDSLTRVRFIDLADNALTGIEDLTGLDALTDLDVSQNLFEFDDLEKLRELPSFTYSPQKTRLSFNETEVADSLLVRVFSYTSLSYHVGGEYNTYEWFRNKSLIENGNEFFAADTLLEILSIDYNSMGKFEAEVRNDSLPDLRIPVDSMFVFAVADLTVDVNDNDGELIPEDVDGYLLLTTQVDKGFDTLNIAKKQPSSFTFNDVILGDYLVSIDSDPSKYIPTYYSDAFEWIEADTVLFRKDSAFQVSMTVIPGELNGVGTLEVLIEEDFGDENGRIDARRRAAKRKCGLRRKTGGGRTGQDNDQYELIAYGETDENGEFKFGFLPEGEYRFFVEYPGIPIDESSFVEFIVGEQGISDTDFKLEAFATADGIEVKIERVLGFIFEYFKDLEVYPNPATDRIKISYRHLTNKEVAAQLVDLSGNVLWSKEIKSGYDGYQEVDLSRFNEGIYLLHIYDENDRHGTVVSYRIMIRR